ncbi:MAG TPA: SDR family NAD(P)-dependent oxidoreductase [Verrucomicrobiae bacterium]|nr:SDR family NAD(P)-dependent oxidoreductase [Verrucomicrobiae bacterium]
MSANLDKRRVAVVTGASSGIGLGMTRAPLERGYRVAANCAANVDPVKALKRE